MFTHWDHCHNYFKRYTGMELKNIFEFNWKIFLENLKKGIYVFFQHHRKN